MKPAFKLPSKRHKYGVAPKEERTHNGVVYASKKEMRECIGLLNMEAAGLISDLKFQVPFDFKVTERVTNPDGTVQYSETKMVKYVADAVYRDNEDGALVCHEVKGHWTKEAKKKAKWFQMIYTEYKFVVT